jgi:transcriptional regulator with XRE-family HTH domain
VNFIAAARKKVGLSQVALAEKLGVSTGTVAAWELLPNESGHSFRLVRLTDLARALRVKEAELLKWWMEMERAA